MSWYVVKEGKRIFTVGDKLGHKAIAGDKIRLNKRQAQSFKDSVTSGKKK